LSVDTSRVGAIAYNGSGLALWRFSVIRQPVPLLIKVTTVDDMFCSRALFVQPELKPGSEQKAENIFVAPP
jgi:hypothetical protein